MAVQKSMYQIEKLGKSKYPSPLLQKASAFGKHIFVSDEDQVAISVNPNALDTEGHVFEKAGPREKVFFNPKSMRAAIVTCGGLCPGLNNVIRSIVVESSRSYGVSYIYGIRYGYNGLNLEHGYNPIPLTPQLVDGIHTEGGTMLGSSRGGTDNVPKLVDALQALHIDVLYTIGGDGTLRGASALAQEIKKRDLQIAVIGIPKTIDNDINYVQQSFGFETAFSVAVDSIRTAHNEACGAPKGIGLVKLMGRHSGYIATSATLAMNDVNFVLVPEEKFALDGPGSFLEALERRMRLRDHAVVCVAEGAGQHLIRGKNEFDASHNVKLKDIGIFLKEKISEHFAQTDVNVNLKYIDPSYIIRSAPACPNDSVFCALLGQHAVHAAMAGKTNMVVSKWNNMYTYVPIALAIEERKKMNTKSLFWYQVQSVTGQPSFTVQEDED